MPSKKQKPFVRGPSASNREKWLEARSSGIGASESATLLGCNPYESLFTLYQRKIGAVGTQLDNERMEWGRRLEDAIAARFSDETGRTVRIGRLGSRLLRSRDYPFLFATPDREQIDGRRRVGLVEIKNVSEYMTDEWSTAVPLHYEVQLQHQLLVTGTPFGSVCALIGGQAFRYRDYGRHEALMRAIVRRAKEFWTRVERREAPPVDPSPSTIDTLSRMKETGAAVELPQIVLDWHERLMDLRREIRERKTEEEELKRLIAANVGTAQYGLLPGDRGVWKYQTIERAGYWVTPKSGRELRFVKKLPKELREAA